MRTNATAALAFCLMLSAFCGNVLAAPRGSVANPTAVPTNGLDTALISIAVEVNRLDRVSEFRITVTPRSSDPTKVAFPRRPRAFLKVMSGSDTVVRCKLYHGQKGKAKVYEFLVSERFLAGSQFTYSHPEERGSAIVPHLYYVKLEDHAR